MDLTSRPKAPTNARLVAPVAASASASPTTTGRATGHHHHDDDNNNDRATKDNMIEDDASIASSSSSTQWATYASESSFGQVYPGAVAVPGLYHMNDNGW